jgi:hypothetical protein
MRDLDQARNLLHMAQKDVTAIKAMSSPADFAVEIFGFHVQQAVEKALKAWLCCKGVAFPRMHDLDELASMLGDAGAALPARFAPLLRFTDFAVAFRYDAFSDLGADMDRKGVAESVSGLLAHVDAVLRQAEAAG